MVRWLTTYATAGLVLGLLFAVVTPLTTQAATTEKESITVSPVSKSLKLDAGQVFSDELTVVNDGGTDYTFTVSAQPYSVRNEDYEPDFFTSKTNTDIKDWVSFTRTTYRIKAGQTQVVPFEIKVPTGATPGGHYGVIFAETQPGDQPVAGNSVERKKRVGTLLYATVNGTFRTGGSFTGIRTPGLQFTRPLKSELNVKNTGNVDFPVTTILAVSDLFGSRKFTGEQTYQVLPQTSRRISLVWDKSPGFGFYKVVTSAKFLDQETSKTSFVLVAPIVFYMVFAVGLLGAVIYFVAKRR